MSNGCLLVNDFGLMVSISKGEKRKEVNDAAMLI